MEIFAVAFVVCLLMAIGFIVLGVTLYKDRTNGTEHNKQDKRTIRMFYVAVVFIVLAMLIGVIAQFFR